MRFLNSAKDFVSSKSSIVPAALATGALAPLAAAVDPITGIDAPALISGGIIAVGAIVTVALGGYFGFKAIKIGLRWFNKVGG